MITLLSFTDYDDTTRLRRLGQDDVAQPHPSAARGKPKFHGLPFNFNF